MKNDKKFVIITICTVYLVLTKCSSKYKGNDYMLNVWMKNDKKLVIITACTVYLVSTNCFTCNNVEAAFDSLKQQLISNIS